MIHLKISQIIIMFAFCGSYIYGMDYEAKAQKAMVDISADDKSKLLSPKTGRAFFNLHAKQWKLSPTPQEYNALLKELEKERGIALAPAAAQQKIVQLEKEKQKLQVKLTEALQKKANDIAGIATALDTAVDHGLAGLTDGLSDVASFISGNKIQDIKSVEDLFDVVDKIERMIKKLEDIKQKALGSIADVWKRGIWEQLETVSDDWTKDDVAAAQALVQQQIQASGKTEEEYYRAQLNTYLDFTGVEWAEIWASETENKIISQVVGSKVTPKTLGEIRRGEDGEKKIRSIIARASGSVFVTSIKNTIKTSRPAYKASVEGKINGGQPINNEIKEVNANTLDILLDLMIENEVEAENWVTLYDRIIGAVDRYPWMGYLFKDTSVFQHIMDHTEPRDLSNSLKTLILNLGKLNRKLSGQAGPETKKILAEIAQIHIFIEQLVQKKEVLVPEETMKEIVGSDEWKNMQDRVQSKDRSFCVQTLIVKMDDGSKKPLSEVIGQIQPKEEVTKFGYQKYTPTKTALKKVPATLSSSSSSSTTSGTPPPPPPPPPSVGASSSTATKTPANLVNKGVDNLLISDDLKTKLKEKYKDKPLIFSIDVRSFKDKTKEEQEQRAKEILGID